MEITLRVLRLLIRPRTIIKMAFAAVDLHQTLSLLPTTQPLLTIIMLELQPVEAIPCLAFLCRILGSSRTSRSHFSRTPSIPQITIIILQLLIIIQMFRMLLLLRVEWYHKEDIKLGVLAWLIKYLG